MKKTQISKQNARVMDELCLFCNLETYGKSLLIVCYHFQTFSQLLKNFESDSHLHLLPKIICMGKKDCTIDTEFVVLKKIYHGNFLIVHMAYVMT